MPDVPSSIGRVEPDGTGVALRYERRLDLPVADAWAALTESDRLATWIGTWTGTGRTGGRIEFLMNAEGDEAAPEPVTVVRCDRPHGFELTWVVPGDEPAWHVEVRLRPDGDGTVGIFSHLLGDTDQVGDIGPGWQYYLDRLDAALHDRPMPDFDDYYPALKDAYESQVR
jgi:uncharacterized protein YndB with AHSA1/START domain